MLLRSLVYSKEEGSHDDTCKGDQDYYELEVKITNDDNMEYEIVWKYRWTSYSDGRYTPGELVFHGRCTIHNSDALSNVPRAKCPFMDYNVDELAPDNHLYLGEFEDKLEDVIAVIMKDEMQGYETFFPRVLNRMVWDYVI